MFSYISGDLIKELRKRKGWQQSYLQELSERPENLLATLSRIENQHQQPTNETMSNVLSLLGMPMERFFCPHLENNAQDADALRDRLLYYLDAYDGDMKTRAEISNLINQLEKSFDMDSLINQQFVLSCKAILCEMNRDYDEAIILIHQGLNITFPDFDDQNFDSGVLLFEESSLLHTLALVYLNTDRKNEAVKLLYRIYEGITNAPQNTLESEKRLLKIAKTLTFCLFDDKNYTEALKIIEKGLNTAIHRNMGLYVPEFTHQKALCLLHIGNQEEGTLFLKYAYFSCVQLGMKKKMAKISEDACRFSITIKTWDVDSVSAIRPAELIKQQNGYKATGDNIGTVIRQLREHMGLKPKEIYSGLCSKSNYSRLESGQYKTASYFLLQSIFQRLGHEIDLYFTALLSKEDMEDLRLYIEIQVNLAVNKYEETQALLNELKKRRFAKQDYGKQFIAMTEVMLSPGVEGDYTQEMRNMLIEALQLTIPDFVENKINSYRLTTNELACISNILIYYRQTEQYDKSEALYEQVIKNLQNNCVNNRRIQDYYVMIVYNFAYQLIYMKMFEDAISLLKEAEGFAVRSGRFTALSGIAYFMGMCLSNIGQIEESKPYYAIAYYCNGLIGNTNRQSEVLASAKEDVGMEFEEKC